MQKINSIGQFIFLLLIATVSLSAHAAVDKAMAEKIKKMAAVAATEESRSSAQSLTEAAFVAKLPARLDNMLIRLNTIKFSLSYYSRFKRKLFYEAMLKGKDEVVRACCPLNPRGLDNQIWWANGNGNKLKGKTLSGKRKKSGKSGGGGGGGGRGRGKNKNKNKGGGDASKSL